MNFFDWIRSGVRRSVLLGVSDAVEQLGSPEKNDPSTNQLMSMLHEDAPQAITQKTNRGTPKKKRLGRSLQQMQVSAEGTS
jgi:hypothetical protein